MNWKLFTIILCALLLVGGVAAWTWQKVNGVYVVTLSSGNKVNVTNITYANTTISAVVKFNKLSMNDVFEITNITEGIMNTAKGKVQKYDQINIIYSK